jgi:hypothetical protein
MILASIAEREQFRSLSAAKVQLIMGIHKLFGKKNQ